MPARSNSCIPSVSCTCVQGTICELPVDDVGMPPPGTQVMCPRCLLTWTLLDPKTKDGWAAPGRWMWTADNSTTTERR